VKPEAHQFELVISVKGDLPVRNYLNKLLKRLWRGEQPIKVVSIKPNVATDGKDG
jgi:hypothetical protein